MNNKIVYTRIYCASTADCIFEREMDNSQLYSMWIEVNMLHRVLEEIYRMFKDDEIDFSIHDEINVCSKIDYLLHLTFGKNLVRNKGWDCCFSVLMEDVELLRPNIIHERESFKSEYYCIGSILNYALPRLARLCSDTLTGEDWSFVIHCNKLSDASKLQELMGTINLQTCEQIKFDW